MWVGEEEEQEGMATHMERQWNMCRSHTNIQHMPHAAVAGQSKTNVSSAQADCRLLQR